MLFSNQLLVSLTDEHDYSWILWILRFLVDKKILWLASMLSMGLISPPKNQALGMLINVMLIKKNTVYSYNVEQP